MTAYPILLLARHNPIKYLLERPALAGRCAACTALLISHYICNLEIRERAIADHPLPDYLPLRTDFHDEEILFAMPEATSSKKEK
jgi:hypothetical protein